MIEVSCSDISGAAAPVPCLLEPKQLKTVLADIFGRVLRRSDIKDQDDFFDLGGDSIIALSLVAEAAKLTGHAIPITALYEASSVSSLTRLLIEKGKLNSSNLVLLKPGHSERPLFIIHGLGGSVMELRELARHMSIKQMIYGLEARGLEGNDKPFDNVEDMALFHIEQIKRVQPNGPYFFAGYSFGGLVALQMAQTLTAAGKKIAFLALIDTYPHAKFWPLTCRLSGWSKLILFQFTAKFWLRLINHWGSVLSQMPWHEVAPFIVRKAWSASGAPFDLFKLGALTHRFADADEIEDLLPAPKGKDLPAHLRNVIDASAKAFAAYRPRFYPGRITFFKAEGAIRVPFDANLLWGKMCIKISVYPVPGNHRNLITKNAKALAERLAACMEREFDCGLKD